MHRTLFLYLSLEETFKAEGIDFKKQMIAIETDSCPAMRGVRQGVVKKLQNTMECIQDLGGCPDHHIANAVKYGMLQFDKTLKDLFVDVYYDIEKYPTHKDRH